EDKANNLKMLEGMISPLKGETDVVILPEMFSTGFSMRPELLAENIKGETVRWMKDMAAKLRLILTGSLIIEENGKYFNRLVWMLPDGNFGYYDKRHLFGFAGEDNHYTAGSKRLIASAKGWKINLQVCYDLRFPVWARQGNGSVEPEYDLLVYVANWPEKRIHAWKTLLQARAIENQCYCVGVNRVGEDGNEVYHSGNSMVVDAMGEVLYTKQDAEDVFTVTLEKETLDSVREKLPFLKDRDGFLISR
ncbi:MAG: nitrilase family protein, partial [Chitinophagaceae bacterium]